MPNPIITDPLYDTQWHFDLLGDIETVWAEYTGVGVTIAVYDDGMDTDHEDLVDNYDASLELSLPDGVNNGPNDGHGTSVGGLIAGANNGLGGVGVAWGATLTSVDFLNDAFDFAVYSRAVDHMSSFDIVNQSYGFDPDFNPDLSMAQPGEGARDYALTFDAAMLGRDGLGTVMVKAAGNSANDSYLQSFGINGNAQGDATNNWHFLVTVGALAPDGTVASFSNYGANLLVSAGAAAVTTDLTGTAGYDAGNYTDQFGGTSAATPVTAGVIALMLEANPYLTVPEVQMILAVSAAMTGSDFGQFGSGWEAEEWRSMGDGTWNGGGMTYNASYGYGAVDAHAAVRMAEIWHVFSDQRTLETQISHLVNDAANYVIVDQSTLDIDFNVTEGVVIDHVYVTLDLQHSFASDLTIQLVAPDGTVIDLADRDGGGNDVDAAWTFGVASLRGIDSEGEWTIRVTDNAFFDTGMVYDASIEFIGAEQSEYDVWHFTDDFLELARVETDRTDLELDAELETLLNFVAVTGNAVVDLGSAGSIRVDNALWAEFDGDLVAAVATGDGDDRILGGDLEDGVLAGRGDDRIFGGSGGDYMGGEAGDDLIFGESHGGYGTQESAEIFRLFNSVFGREPGRDGHQAWMTERLSGDRSLDEVAAQFIQSAEFQITYGSTNNTEFVSLLFENVLGRPPAEAGLAGWVSNIENGMSRAEVVRRISESAENELITRDSLQSFEENADPTVFAPRIYRLFEAIFGREPNPAGFEAWVNNFENGMTFQEAVTNFMASPEFEILYAGTDNEGFMRTLFENVLGRPPAESGLAAWTANLDGGMARETVVELFVDGPEFIIRTADALVAFMENLLPDVLDDTIEAGAGTNLVFGGLYADEFIFDQDDGGTTTIHGWEQWDDLVFEDFGFSSAEELFARFVQAGDNVVFASQGTTVIIEDALLADVLASDMWYYEEDAVFS